MRHRTRPPLHPRTWTTRSGQATRREDLWVQVRRPGPRTRDRRPDEALLGRPACSQGHKDQSLRSALDETPAAHKPATVHRHAKPRRLRAEEVEPDRQDRDRSRVPESSTSSRPSRTPAASWRHRSPPNVRRRSVPTPTQPRFGSSGSGSDSKDSLATRGQIARFWRVIASRSCQRAAPAMKVATM